MNRIAAERVGEGERPPTQSWNSTSAERPASSPTPSDSAIRRMLPRATKTSAAPSAATSAVAAGGARKARHATASSDASDEHEGVMLASSGAVAAREDLDHRDRSGPACRSRRRAGSSPGRPRLHRRNGASSSMKPTTRRTGLTPTRRNARRAGRAHRRCRRGAAGPRCARSWPRCSAARACRPPTPWCTAPSTRRTAAGRTAGSARCSAARGCQQQPGAQLQQRPEQQQRPERQRCLVQQRRRRGPGPKQPATSSPTRPSARTGRWKTSRNIVVSTFSSSDSRRLRQTAPR